MAQNPSNKDLITPAEINEPVALLQSVLDELNRLLLGRPKLHELVLAGILSRGHILLEGLPGLGKTALVTSLGKLMDLDFKRVQFTPDLMPSDILGHHVLEEQSDGSRSFTFHDGPVFTNILLADEINRSSPKTQAALLEAMQEHAVTLMGTTRKLPEPFFVLASQNPIELEGTYPLPEAQQDRFLFKLHVSNPDAATLEQIIGNRRHGALPDIKPMLTREGLLGLFAMVDRVYLPPAVSSYIARLVGASHPDSPEAPAAIRNYVKYGASPRAAIAIAEAARSLALLRGRPTVGFDDVAEVAPAVLNHRLLLVYAASFENVAIHDVITELLNHVEQAPLGLPDDVSVPEQGSKG